MLDTLQQMLLYSALSDDIFEEHDCSEYGLIDGLGYIVYSTGSTYCIEMDTGYIVTHQFLTLLDAPFGSEGA